MGNLRWGIIGLGNIAGQFANDLNLVKGSELYAVASRSIDKAEAFKETHYAKVAYGSYEELLADSEVDIIYIATPHSHHYQNTLMCLEAGKHVLCEKAFAVNTAQVKAMINKAKEKNLFLMEAMWSRFNPTIQAVKEDIDNGLIGKPLAVKADFCFYFDYNTSHRLIAKELAGGSLLDIGIYPIFLSYLMFGKPVRMYVDSEYFPNGVDKNVVMLFDYENGEEAILNSSLQYFSPGDAFIYGDKGSIRINGRWHESDGFTRYEKSYDNPLTTKFNIIGKGYSYEIMECERCVMEGKIQSDLWTWQNSIDIMEIMDEIRGMMGMDYGEIENL